MAAKDWKELVDKINATFLSEVLCTWKQCQDKITKMKEKYCDEHKTCNTTVLLLLGHGMKSFIAF